MFLAPTFLPKFGYTVTEFPAAFLYDGYFFEAKLAKIGMV